MASSASETSYWINFFTNAGIPAGDAAHYAIIFSDNRITRDMLMDLSKEYLTDMGISRLGDVIAILKHCKTVATQEAKDKVLRSSSLTSLSALTASPMTMQRRSTAASRMVNQITSKHPEAAPMSSSPVPKLPPPDPPKSKRKVSVFERLGAEGADEITISTNSSSSSSMSQSVFNRLGGKSAVKRQSSGMVSDEMEDQSEGGLPYAGVLKSPSGPSPAKKANIKVAVNRKPVTPQQVKRLPLKIKKTITAVPVEEKKVSQIQRPEISTTTEGVLSDFAKREAPSLRDRLGTKSAEASVSASSPAGKVSSTSKLAGMQTKVAGIQKRLGVKQADLASSSDDVSSTQQVSANLKKQRALSSSKQAAAAAAQSKPSGIFSRLGKKTAV